MPPGNAAVFFSNGKGARFPTVGSAGAVVIPLLMALFLAHNDPDQICIRTCTTVNKQ